MPTWDNPVPWKQIYVTPQWFQWDLGGYEQVPRVKSGEESPLDEDIWSCKCHTNHPVLSNFTFTQIPEDAIWWSDLLDSWHNKYCDFPATKVEWLVFTHMHAWICVYEQGENISQLLWFRFLWKLLKEDFQVAFRHNCLYVQKQLRIYRSVAAG